jgi:hypothetical protein
LWLALVCSPERGALSFVAESISNISELTVAMLLTPGTEYAGGHQLEEQLTKIIGPGLRICLLVSSALIKRI